MGKSVVRACCALWFVAMLLAANSARAQFSDKELLAFDNEPPVIAELLQRAVLLERNERLDDGDWQAAKLYCQASRYGSAEAYFRLGILYAVGKGVPANRDLAAALFAAASMQGHYESQKMLETVELVYVDMPACVTSAVDPEKSMQSRPANIDSLIANLPENKRWILSLVDTIATWYKV
ncbi:MAG: lytic transglycosylase, partial [Methylophilales bacterium 16-45-9]